ELPSWRILATIGASVVVLGGVVLAGWLWFSARQHRALESFAEAMVKVQRSQAQGASPEAKLIAIRELEATLNQQPSATVVAQVTYELGNLKYQEQQYPSSRLAYELAAASSSPTLSRLAQVNVGYTWEAQKDYAKAIETFQRAVASLKPGEFLYDELLVDLARVQELAGQKDAAIKTYRRVLENPKTRRSEDIRARLATLEK
ncbi:MAG: tetratricopeptide repeat protein, partial [Candidatus Rokuibacteriota bacterium]